jgi:hypothetical protein
MTSSHGRPNNFSPPPGLHLITLNMVTSYPGFCDACMRTTLPTTANPNVIAIPFGIGYRFYGPEADMCKTCGSVLLRQAFCILFIPMFPAGRYRVKYVGFRSYVSRKLPGKSDPATTAK